MRAGFSGLLVVLATVAPLSSALGQGPVQFAIGDNVASCLAVRARPESTAPSIACLSSGVRVEAVGIAPYWRQIRLQDGRTGWAAKKFLEIVAPPLPATASDDRDDAWLYVYVVDVGQGDGIWIHTFDDNIPGNGRYEGYNIIVDGGPNSADQTNALLQYVKKQAHEGAVIDALIITHPHNDHYPGARGILKYFEVREFYEPGYPKDNLSWRNFRALVDAERFEGRPILEHVGRASFGTPNWGGELRVQFLYAYTGDSVGFGTRDNTRENNASIVFRIQYGSQSILFMGDAEGKQRKDSSDVARYAERFLLDSVGPAGLKSTVLKIGHHGSETSSTDPFIAAVDPDYVVVSSGRRKYDQVFLPDSATLRRYCRRKPATRIYRTDQDDRAEGRTEKTDADGDNIVISTNGKETRIQAYSGGNPITPTTCIP